MFEIRYPTKFVIEPLFIRRIPKNGYRMYIWLFMSTTSIIDRLRHLYYIGYVCWNIECFNFKKDTRLKKATVK